MRHRITASFAALLLFAACQGSPSADAAIDCVNIDGCPADEVCFFGKCVDPNFDIDEQEVWADVSPPDNSGLLPQVDFDSPHDLAASLQQDITLRASVTLRGDVTTSTGSVRTGELVATPYLQPEHVLVPSAVRQTRATVGDGGFELRLVPGEYALTFEPYATGTLPPVVLTADTPLSTADSAVRLAYTYPEDEDLVRVCGEVLPDASSPFSLEGAIVTGTARDAGGRTLRSTTAVSTLDGYELVFPPGAQSFAITVRRDTTGGNEDIPTATQPLSIIEASSSCSGHLLEPFVLDVAEGRTELTARILGPNDETVSDANLFFQGMVGAGTVTETAATGSQGTVSTSLLPGTYQLTVVPQRSQPYALTTTASFCVGEVADPSGCDTVIPTGESARFTVRNKVTLEGTILDFHGRAVEGAQLTFRLQSLPLPLAREFVTTTTAGGFYQLAVDPGTDGAPVTYEVTVQPSQSGATPRPLHREIIEVGAGARQQIDLRMYDVSLVYGTVRGPGGSPLGATQVAFYSTEILGSPAEPLLVGVGQSNQDGEFVIPLPILEKP